MKSLLGLRAGNQSSSPLETGAFRMQQAESGLRELGRREWWLWFSSLAVTLLSITAVALSFFPSLFRRTEHFYELRPDQALWGTTGLLLVFNSWMVYRQWSFRRMRKQLAGDGQSSEGDANEISSPSGFDPVTGLYTRSSIEHQLGKEIAAARRLKTSLSLATLHLDEFAQINERHGRTAGEVVLKEFARRLRKAIRGSDFAVRLGGGDFVLVLPECSLGEVKLILNRVGVLEVNASGRRIPVAYSTGWVDYQAGDMPSDLLKRAAQILHLYEHAAKDTVSATLAS
jgi:diguanylate cyclase (GGDEF)-like protein